jgi:hypothetical protein
MLPCAIQRRVSIYRRWVDELVPCEQYACSLLSTLRGNSTAMHMTIPEPLDEPIEASQLTSAFHHRMLLHHQSTQTQGDQKPLLHPNEVTDLVLRIVNPTPDIFTAIAANCPNLQVLTIYDGVDFQPSHPLEVPCRFAPDWATGLPGLHSIEKLIYLWTLDTPHDSATEEPRRTRPTTRYDPFFAWLYFHPNVSSADGTKKPNDTLFQFSVRLLQAFKRLSLPFWTVGAQREKLSGASKQPPVGWPKCTTRSNSN